MMNIFIMVLVAIFMAGFYMFTAPSQRITEQETEYAIDRADLRSIAECAAAAHNATIHRGQFNDPCVEQNAITSKFVCLNANLTVIECQVVARKKPAYSFIITATGTLDPAKYNDMMEILEQDFADAGTFGLFQDNVIISGGTATKRGIPAGIVSDMQLENGQLVYMTQYEIPDDTTEFETSAEIGIECPAGTVPAYRFGRWQCIGYNTKTDCAGDTIWDGSVQECVADESRRPLCAQNQTAVLVDNIWECINPFPDKNCPDGMIARLNYNNLEWECVSDPTKTQDVKKCTHITGGTIYGKPGATLRTPQTSCTDCEKMLVDPDTCRATCVPDPAKINDPKCYPGGESACQGPSRGFFFGFPNQKYVQNAAAAIGNNIYFDANKSPNRKFNCLDCGAGVIDTDKSVAPYTAVCK